MLDETPEMDELRVSCQTDKERDSGDDKATNSLIGWVVVVSNSVAKYLGHKG